MSSIIENLVESLQNRREKALLNYAELVRVIASDSKPPSTAAIEVTLQASGKTIGDLQTDVATANRRNDLRGQIKQAAELQAERPAIDAAISKAAETLQAAQDVFDLAVAPLRAKIDAINSAQHTSSLAEGELARTRPDHFDDRSDALEKNLRRASDAKHLAEKHLAEMKSRIPLGHPDSDWGAVGERKATPAEVAEYDAGIKRAKDRLQTAQAAADEAVSDQDEHHVLVMAS